MEIQLAAATLSALAHESRLSVFQLLVTAGPEGLAAGEIARRLGMLPNSLSANLTILSHANLVASHRDGRSIIYQARYDQMAALLGFLMKDCCNGQPEVCAPLTRLVSQAACCD
jgi:ArsR family transcriptional regulator